jgi:mono/diheme cytochrome c family protein
MFHSRTGLVLALLALCAAPVFADTAAQRGGGFALEGGEAIYRGVCQGCHMADAKGASGAGAYLTFAIVLSPQDACQ